MKPCIYLARCTLGSVQRRPLLGLAEIGVVGVAAPQLFAGVIGAELWKEEKYTAMVFGDGIFSRENVFRGKKKRSVCLNCNQNKMPSMPPILL